MLAASRRIVLLFPGQGAYSPALLCALAAHSEDIAALLHDLSDVATAEGVSGLGELNNRRGPALVELLADDPALLQAAIYASSVAMARVLLDSGVQPKVHLGHSLGEIAALAAGGACSEQDGMRIVARRSRLLSRLDSAPGQMVAVGTDGATAQRALALLNCPDTALAGPTAPNQSVVSGPTESVNRLVGIARAAGLSTMAVDSPYAFHSPVLAPLVQDFAGSLADITWHQPSVEVYSAILGRPYQASDRLPLLLAQQLVLPFDFPAALRELVASGADAFIECGARQILTRLTRKSLTSWTGPIQAGDPAVPGAIGVLQPGGADAEAAALGVLLPSADTADLVAFWQSEGSAALAELRARHHRWQAANGSTANGSTPDGSTANGSAVNGSTANGSTVNGAAVNNSAANGSTVNGSAANGSAHRTPGSIAAGVAADAQPDRETVFAELASLYGQALEYPVEVFTEQVELEADLGVDSVKQTDLLGRVAQRYAMPAPGEGFRIGDYPRFGDVVSLALTTAAQSRPTDNGVAGDDRAPDLAPDLAPDREMVFAELASLYGQALEYPVEVFTEQVELEADLGVDSVKQTDLLGRVAQRYAMPAPGEGFRIGDYPRFGDVISLVLASGERREAGLVSGARA